MGKALYFRAALCAGAAAVAASLFARLMNYDMRRDEQLYVSPAALLDGQRIYHDFFYNHVPGSAWLYRAAYEVAGGAGLLFSARLTVFLVWILFAAAAAFLTWRLTRSTVVAGVAVVFLVFNDFLLGVVGALATNNFLPLPFAYAGLCLFVLGVRGEGVFRRGSPRDGPNRLTIAAAGLSFAIALAMKVSAIAFVAPTAAAALLLPRTSSLPERLRSVLAPFALGGLIGAAPVLIEFVRAPDIFLAHVVQYHTGPHIAYYQGKSAGEDEVAMGLGAKAMLAHQIWFGGVNLLLALSALIGVLTTSVERKARDRTIGLAVAVAAAVAIFGFAPTPSFPQYFAPLTVALVFLLGVSLAPESGQPRSGQSIALAAAAALAVIVGAPRLAQHAPKLLTPDKWTVARVHAAGKSIARAMAASGVDGKVLTLLPIYPLEGGLDVYREFATGQFVYRTGDLTEPSLLAKYRTTSPARIAAFLESDPPAAMLLGFEPDLEAPMAEFARRKGYRRVDGLTIKDRYGDGYLVVRPAMP
jgi:hypothetical protein